MRRYAFTAFALSGLIICTLAARPVHADDWSKTYKLAGRPTLRVTTNDAHIDLYATDAPQIDAHVTTRGWTIGERGVTITESQSGNDVTLNVHVPNMHFFFGWNNRSVRLELHVPRSRFRCRDRRRQRHLRSVSRPAPHFLRRRQH